MIDLLFADDGTHSHIINTLSGISDILKNDTDTASIIILFIETSKGDAELMSKVCGTNPIRTPLDISILEETLLNAASTK